MNPELLDFDNNGKLVAPFIKRELVFFNLVDGTYECADTSFMNNFAVPLSGHTKDVANSDYISECSRKIYEIFNKKAAEETGKWDGKSRIVLNAVIGLRTKGEAGDYILVSFDVEYLYSEEAGAFTEAIGTIKIADDFFPLPDKLEDRVVVRLVA